MGTNAIKLAVIRLRGHLRRRRRQRQERDRERDAREAARHFGVAVEVGRLWLTHDGVGIMVFDPFHTVNDVIRELKTARSAARGYARKSWAQTEIEQSSTMSVEMIRKWNRRFNDDGLDYSDERE